ncbi:eukaryotic translation elongation factor 1 epsilon-1-like [Petromyzon marinus]|uniref:eukaryotic translation elongation factor 1 epsilon-1-like n=1 Tax=Petromyzon marinus TaxID=7757 RepID=UPI003F718CCE
MESRVEELRSLQRLVGGPAAPLERQAERGVPVLHVGDGSSVVGLVSSACHVVRASGQLQLLGLDAGDRAVVQQWAEYAVALEQGNKDSLKTALRELNDYLADRVFIVGNYLTLADILLYHRLHPVLAVLGVQEREQHVNVCRWFDNVQRWPRVRQHLPMLVILRNKIYS